MLVIVQHTCGLHHLVAISGGLVRDDHGGSVFIGQQANISLVGPLDGQQVASAGRLHHLSDTSFSAPPALPFCLGTQCPLQKCPLHLACRKAQAMSSNCHSRGYTPCSGGLRLRLEAWK